jgi:hypothetical protein
MPTQTDLEDECKEWIARKTKDKKFRLTVAKFCHVLNNSIIPSHSGLESELVNPKTSVAPYISHTVTYKQNIY